MLQNFTAVLPRHDSISVLCSSFGPLLRLLKADKQENIIGSMALQWKVTAT